MTNDFYSLNLSAMSDPASGRDPDALLSGLDPDSDPSRLFQTLVSLRTKHLKSKEKTRVLLDKGLVKRLVLLLQRPNSKIVDVTLSILGNLMLEPLPRKTRV